MYVRTRLLLFVKENRTYVLHPHTTLGRFLTSRRRLAYLYMHVYVSLLEGKKKNHTYPTADD